MEVRSVFIALLSLLFVQTRHSVAKNVHGLGDEILTITKQVLGASAFKSYLAEGNKFHNDRLQADLSVKQLAMDIEDKLKTREEAIKRLRRSVTDSFNESSWGKYTECCKISSYDLNLDYDSRFLGKVDVNSLCTMKSSLATKVHEIPNDSFLKAALKNLEEFPGIKAQYFGSDSGTLLSFPASPVSDCGSYDNRFRPWYVQASAPVAKDIVLMVDMSGSMEKENRMKAAIHAAHTILESLGPNDRVAVIGFSDYAYAVGSDRALDAISKKNYGEPGGTDMSCYDGDLVVATPHNIHHLSNAVAKMVPHGETNYTTGLTMAFDFLFKTLKQDVVASCGPRKSTPTEIAYSRHRSIIFLSDGKPSDLPLGILNLVYERNLEMHNSVVLLCYALGKGTFGHFIHRMSRQEFVPETKTQCKSEQTTSSNICEANGAKLCNLPPPKIGLFRQVTDSKYLRSEMGSYYNYFASKATTEATNDVTWSVPYFDAGGLGMVVTAASPIVLEKQLIGVVGTDLTMREMMADVSYFHAGGQASYAFLMDVTGRVLLHPYISSPATVKDDPVLTDIGAFERTPEIRQFLEGFLDKYAKEGDQKSVKDAPLHKKSAHTKRAMPLEHRNVLTRDAYLSYTCMGVRYLVVCVVVDGEMASHTGFSPQELPDNFNFLYHRFDISPPSELCRYQGDLSSGEKSSVFLAPSAFVDIGKHLGQPETSKWISELKGYMSDPRSFYMGVSPEQLAAEVNVRPGIRDAVRVTSRLDDIWNGKNSSSADISNDDDLAEEDLRRNVLFRYFSSENGVFRIHPGVQMPKSYNPVHRPWYEQARTLISERLISAEECESVICGDAAAVSPPYLDASGAGVVITISQPILASPLPDDEESKKVTGNVVGVMAGDLRMQFLEKILRETTKECEKDSGFECILIDIAGYVIYDHTLAEMDEAAIELIMKTSYHLTYAHRVIAEELFRQGVLVRKQCVDISKVAFTEEYRVDIKRLSELGDDLLFKAYHVNYTNMVLLIIPSDFWVPQYLNQKHCIEHDVNTVTCERPAGSTQCESPCVNDKDSKQHYEVCSNSFNYTWEQDPPPCVPEKYIDERLEIVVEKEGGSGIPPFEISSLEECFADYDAIEKTKTASLPLGAILTSAALLLTTQLLLRVYMRADVAA